MKIASIGEIQAAEQALIAGGTSAESLMEEAGKLIAELIVREWGTEGLCAAYLGKGNNAGDALVVLRYLRAKGWRIAARETAQSGEGTDLYKLQKEKLGPLLPWNPDSLSITPGPVVLLDGLVGLGAKGPLREPYQTLAREINECRKSGRIRVVSIDFPSGVDGDTGEVFPDAVIADISAVIAIAKKGMLEDDATGNIGRIIEIPLPGLDVRQSKPGEVPSRRELASLMPPRPYNWFKGNAGRVAVIAGSAGMTGAARLCSESVLRAGGGMVTLFVPPEIYPLLASCTEPEVMVKSAHSYAVIAGMHVDCLLIGPGLGHLPQERETEVIELITRFEGPVVLDADGLNMIARNNLSSSLGKNVLITPHVGEMQRLLPRRENETRSQWATRFIQSGQAALLLKGARTLVAQKEKPLAYNVTGGPGMGTAGEGDVLSGVCAGLCAQGISPYDAGVLGAWLCGRASELALTEGESEQSLTASTTSRYLGRAFNDLFLNPV